MLILLSSRAAFAFNGPADEADWVPLTQSGVDMIDLFDDHDRDGLGAPDAIDCVGDDTTPAPAMYWYATDEWFSLRVRVDDSPWYDEDAGQLLPANWSFLLETDDNLLTYEYLISVDGIDPSAQLWINGNHLEGADAAPDSLKQYFEDEPDNTYVRVVDAGTNIHTVGDWFIDVSIPVDELSPSDFVGDYFRVAVVTGNATTPVGANNDLCGIDNSTGLGDLEDAWSDTIGIDQDDDGLTDIEEDALGTDKADADTDDDGVSDGDELLQAANPLECDTDGDGLTDGVEMGVTEAGEDTDVSTGCFEADGDASVHTNPALADTDEGGVADGDEDRDQDGVQDEWETDPNAAWDDLDEDGDGITDAIEDHCDLGGPEDDRDADGIPDADEGYDDTDGDGTPDFCQADDDNDGVATLDEGTGDADEDGLADYLDSDSDGNGVLDGEEPTGDADCDGTLDAYDLDDSDGPCGDQDGDTLNNDEEAACGSNPTDTDTDNDGVTDDRESCDEDVDCDQLPDRIDGETDPAGCDPEDTGSPGSDTGPASKDECAGDDILCGGHYTGGACATGPGAGILAIMSGGLFAIRRRKRAILLSGLAASPVVLAADPAINAQRYQPALDSQSFFSVQDSVTGPGGFGAGVGFNYAQSPFRYTYDDPETAPVELLGSAATFDLGVGYSWKPLALSVGLPLHLIDGDRMDGQFSPGDVRIGARVELLRRDKAGLGLGLFGGLGLPTGDETSWVGAPAPEGNAGVSLAAGKSVVVAGNAGVRLGATTAFLPDLDWGNRFAWGGGISVPIGEQLRVIGEVDGELSLDSGDAVGASPIEWRAGARASLTRNLVASAGFGTGLTDGIGAPTWRVTTGLSWLPAEKIRPTPLPTLPPTVAVPQTSNVVDIAPLGGTVIVTAQNGAGQPLACLVTILGEGRKFTTGPDGIGTDRVAAGEVELSVWSEGYRPARQKVTVEAGKRASVSVTLEPSRVMVLADRVDIRDKIFFEFDSATITADSFAVLDDVAATLDNHVEIELVEVQGHTDNQGTEEYNLTLSQGRAEAVRAYLVSQGIDPNRLVARGYGESQALQPGDTPEAHEVNRRVVFKIVKGTKLPEGKPMEPGRGPKRGRNP